MNTFIYLIRHGESTANAQGIYQGQSVDAPLSEKGVEQAEAVAKTLSEETMVTTLFSSPLLRTRETAQIISDTTGVPTIIDPLIVEMNHGSWEGKRETDFDDSEKQILAVWRSNPQATQMINGEHFEDVVRRSRKFLDLMELTEGNTVVVTHDVIIRILISLGGKRPFEKIWDLKLHNGGISLLNLTNWKVVEIDRTDHLGGSLTSLKDQAL